MSPRMAWRLRLCAPKNNIKSSIENNAKKIRALIGLKSCFY